MSPKRTSALLWLVFLLIFSVSCRKDEATPTPEIASETAVPHTLPPSPPSPPPTPAGLGIISLNDTSPLAPAVIGQNPALGEEAPLDGSFEVYFDQPMDAAATDTAVQVTDPDGNPIPGELSWPQTRILRFKPTANLKPDSEYRLLLGDTAVSATGQSLLEGLTLSFYTIGDLAVSQVSPAPDGSDVAIDTAVTVIFNRPVIPLQVNQEGLQNPDTTFQSLTASLLSFDPPVSGSGEWINTSVYVFRPDVAWSGSVRYSARVNAAAVNELSATGAVMAADYDWSFVTTAPTYRYLSLPGLTSSPRSEYRYLPLDQPISVLFSQPMDKASTETAVSLTSDAAQNAPYVAGWNANATTLTITPTQLLDLGTWYTFNLDNSAQSASGGTLRQGLTWRAKTYLTPEIFFTDPADGEVQDRFSSGFQIQFTSPMRFSTLADKVIFDPPLDDDQGYYSEWDYSYRFYGLQPSTRYTVQILPGMTDLYGNAITAGQTVQFTTAAYAPIAYFNLPGRLGLYRAGGSTAAWAAYRNANELNAALYRITAGEFDDLLYGGLTDVNFVPGNDRLIWQQDTAVTPPLNTLTYKRYDIAAADGSALQPGLYFLTLDSPQVQHDAVHLQAQPLIMANANVTLKTTGSEALIWVTGLDSGAPLAGVPVTLYSSGFTAVSSGETDANGVIYWDNLTLDTTNYRQRYYAVAEGKGVYGLAIHDWTDGVEPYDFGISTNYYVQQNQPTAYIYTDRPIYRPDQTVSFKGVVRINDDLSYSLPTYHEALVTINSFNGEVYRETLPLSEFGTFTAQFELDSEAALGSYYIGVEANGRDIGYGYFDVAEYRKPTFQVTVDTPATDVADGETIDVTVDATFFSGGVVVDGTVDWVAQATDYSFNPGGNLSRYSFNNDTRDTGYYYYGYYGYDYGETVASGSGTTDGNGRYTITLPAELAADSGSKTFTIEATVTDLASNQVSGRSNVTVHASRVYPGIRPDRYVGTAGDEMAFDLAAVDWDGEPVANQIVSVEIVERRWYSVQEENDAGELIWRTSVEEIPAASFDAVTLDGNGRASIAFTPPNGGVFRAYVRARDVDGKTAVASTYVWVSGGNYVSWRRLNDHSFELIADRDSYSPGDTAELLIASPFQGESYALVTIERGHIKDYQTIHLTNNSTILRLPITGDMAPNVFVSVMVMKGVDETNPSPDFKVGMVQFTVEREEQELTIDIIPDHETLGPRDTVQFTVRVRDYEGNPVQAELSLALADLAALSIASDNSRPILDYFYSDQWLSVMTALLLTRNMDAYNAELQEQIKGGGGGGGDFGIMTIREDFPDTAYWRGQITTDANGEATVSITLPDNLTTWRMDARAVTEDTKVGQATHDIVTTKPVLVSPLTPRFFVVGDEARVGTAVHNNTDQPLSANVTLQAEGVTLHNPDTQVIEIPARQQGVVYWNVVVNDVERVDFVFSVNAGEYSDASRPTLGTLEGQGIPVYKYEVPETVGTSGQLLDGGAVVESIALPIFPDYTPSNGTLTIEMAPSLVAAMADGLDYLEHYEYECTEQVVSRFLPNVLTTNALRAAGISNPTLERNLQAQVNIALQKLYSRQRADGGWPWWDGERTNTLVSAYVVQALVEARAAGYDVDNGVITRGTRYLRTNLPNVDELNGRYKNNRQAYLLYVLARAGELAPGEISRLYQIRENLDLYARAYLAQAIMLMDDADPRLETIAADFISTAIFSATGTHWEEAQRDYWNWNTDTRTTSIVLDTMIKLQPDNPVVVNAVRWLMDSRVNGRWASTQETAWTLMSLTDWLIVSGELQPDYQYEVAFNGQLLATADVTADTVRDTLTLQKDVTELLTDGLNRLAIGRTEGDGNLYYTAHLNIWLPVEEVLPLDRGLILSRSYYRPDDRETPVTEAELGETFLARLTIVVPHALHYALIEDYLPAGLEAVDTSLLTSQQVGAPQRYDPEDFWQRGYGWWYFDHVELRDEKVAISADYLPAGTYEYVYLVRASTVGEFRAIPPTGQEFYFPEVYGRGAGSLFTVYAPGEMPQPVATEPTPTPEPTPQPTPQPTPEATPTVTTQSIGQSANGQEIMATRIGWGETAVLLVGGMHAGFAPSTVTVAEEAIAYFTQHSDELPANVSLYVIPTLNPDSVGGGVETVNGRTNGNGVDLNRNWGCNWSAEATWRNQAISGGAAAFSEPETQALRDFVLEIEATAVIVFEAKGQIAVPGVCNGVSISEELAQVYADAAGYEAGIISLTTVTGDVTDWLDSQGIPAIAPLLADYETVDWEANLAGIVGVVTAVANP
ncbi:MAG: Ig-like domain-containing protein [Ardenticatenaceae bacterium]|nr:Ig-like domain-containing protein [Ardenticatenaceae bacterium]